MSWIRLTCAVPETPSPYRPEGPQGLGMTKLSDSVVRVNRAIDVGEEKVTVPLGSSRGCTFQPSHRASSAAQATRSCTSTVPRAAGV